MAVGRVASLEGQGRDVGHTRSRCRRTWPWRPCGLDGSTASTASGWVIAGRSIVDGDFGDRGAAGGKKAAGKPGPVLGPGQAALRPTGLPRVSRQLPANTARQAPTARGAAGGPPPHGDGQVAAPPSAQPAGGRRQGCCAGPAQALRGTHEPGIEKSSPRSRYQVGQVVGPPGTSQTLRGREGRRAHSGRGTRREAISLPESR